MTGPGGLNLTKSQLISVHIPFHATHMTQESMHSVCMITRTKSDQITVDLGPHTLLGYTHDPGVHALGLHDHLGPHTLPCYKWDPRIHDLGPTPSPVDCCVCLHFCNVTSTLKLQNHKLSLEQDGVSWIDMKSPVKCPNQAWSSMKSLVKCPNQAWSSRTWFPPPQLGAGGNNRGNQLLLVPPLPCFRLSHFRGWNGQDGVVSPPASRCWGENRGNQLLLDTLYTLFPT